MIDSSVRNLGKFEYDKQNCLQHHKTQVWMKNLKRGLSLSFPLHKNRNQSITKKFPIKTLLKTIDSSVKSLGEVEYDTQISLRYQETHVRQLVVNHVKVPKIHWSPFGRNFAI